MKSVLLALFLLLSLASLSAKTESEDENYKAGEVIVMLQNGASINNVILSIEERLGINTVSIKSVLSIDLNIYLLSFDALKCTNERMIVQLYAITAVALAQNNHYTKNRATNPNDTYFGNMWAMNNTGQSGIAGSDINAVEAWDISTGGLTSTGDTIVVAVVDDGFYLLHEDLNFWKNYHEIPNNAIDDDGNGYVDDYHGWNALSDNGTITVMDHGTHVSGTIGAKGNNSKGVTGINWNVKVMAVEGSTTLESQAIKGYAYVYKQRKLYNKTNGDSGAFVVSSNSSFGVDYGKPVNFPIWCAMYDSCGVQGIISIGATANLNIDIDVKSDIPTACPSDYLLTVTNTNSSDLRTNGSAWGLTTIDIGAPGYAIWSTLPNNAYGGNSWTGTSMASPHVTGTVALMMSTASPVLIGEYKQYPDSFAKIFKNWILCGADPNTSLTGKSVTGGRLNVFNTLVKVQDEIVCGLNPVSRINVVKNNIFKVYPSPSSDWLEVNYNLNSTLPYSFEVYDALGRKIKLITHEASHVGLHQHKLDLGSLTNGAYSLHFKTAEGEVQTAKFIKVE